MKRRIIFALLVLAALLCGCAAAEKPSPDVSAPPSPTTMQPTIPPSDGPETQPPTETATILKPSSEVSKDPVLHYRAIRSRNWETSIRRATLDPQGYCLSVFFEVPVFDRSHEQGAGYQKISQFFDELQRQFFTPENEILTAAWSNTIETGMPITEDQPFFYERNAWINSQTDQLVSVTIDYHWMMGGVHDVGTDSYTFRVDTGELVKLTDLVDGTEEELIELIFAALEERNSQEEYGVGQIELEYLQDYALDDFEFCVVGEQIVIRFDRYEASYGAYGNFAVTLPITINPKF